MKKLAPFAFLALISLALPACNQTTVASNSSGLQRTGYNSASMPAPAVSASPTRQASAMGRSNGAVADCRSKFAMDPNAYSACLQNLPASALVASNR
ncbi:MAG: hypothetical protein HXX15_22070 [Rhodopseudomonas sp.]|uniref:hypothetical protein n=1 Tax=Rhodopseudomonas sp. TaxID=1078 RepID=UPI0017B0ECD8|nr:hypothetical protein [Rhodopseudomonas sp.]NVN88771.1 hypothetical protein [Rhodopseudomonas sp.]